MKKRKAKKIKRYYEKIVPKEVSEQITKDLEKLVEKQEEEIKINKDKIKRNLSSYNFNMNTPLINVLKNL